MKRHRRGGRARSGRLASEQTGQSSVLMLGLAGALLAGFLVLASFGQALGAKGRHQRGADLAAVSAARAMRDVYPRLFEPALLEDGAPNPRHLSEAAYRELARNAAVKGASDNGIALREADVGFPGATFAATRVSVTVRGSQKVRIKSSGRQAVQRLAVRARAEAELSPTGPAGMPAMAEGGGYAGPLAYRNGKPMRPDVAKAFDRMAVAARKEAGVTLTVTSGFRSDAEQAKLFAAHPDPKWVAPPGRSLHRLGTELDLGPPAAYAWLARNSRRFGFVKRYAWEAWHFGYTRNAGSSSVGFGRGGKGDGRRSGSLPSFVPARYRETILSASQRYNVGAALLAAQIYAESGFNPFARSRAGAQGIAQFMPATARAYGLSNPFDAEAAIHAQARLMRDNLRRFASVPLALAAYNAGPAAVARCMCIPPYPETRAYVAKILGLLGGAGDAAAPTFEVRLVE